MIPQLASEGTVPVTVLRDGIAVELDMPVASSRDDLLPAIGNGYPEYFIIGAFGLLASSQRTSL